MKKSNTTNTYCVFIVSIFKNNNQKNCIKKRDYINVNSVVQLLVTVHTITVDHRDLRIKKMLHVKINKNTKFQFDVKLLLGKGGENIHVQHNTISYLQL